MTAAAGVDRDRRRGAAGARCARDRSVETEPKQRWRRRSHERSAVSCCASSRASRNRSRTRRSMRPVWRSIDLEELPDAARVRSALPSALRRSRAPPSAACAARARRSRRNRAARDRPCRRSLMSCSTRTAPPPSRARGRGLRAEDARAAGGGSRRRAALRSADGVRLSARRRAGRRRRAGARPRRSGGPSRLLSRFSMRRAASFARRSRPSPSTTSTPSTMPDRMAAMRARSVSRSLERGATIAQPSRRSHCASQVSHAAGSRWTVPIRHPTPVRRPRRRRDTGAPRAWLPGVGQLVAELLHGDEGLSREREAFRGAA